jgi:hypothetical protein
MQRLTLACRLTFGSASFAWLLTTVSLAKYGYAQSNTPVLMMSEPAVEPRAPMPQGADAAAAAATDAAVDDATVDQDFAKPDIQGNEVQSEDYPAQGNTGDDTSPSSPDDEEQPPVTDLETGLPLRYFLAPFHWARFSLLSVTSYEGYNSNPQIRSGPVGAWITSVSTLALFSSQFSGWQLNLQYQPFIWFSRHRTLEDFAATSADLRTIHHLNETWHWSLADRLRYSPTHSAEQSAGFVSDPGGGFSIGNAFLSSGRNVFTNGLVGTLTARYNSNSTLILRADQDYTRLSRFSGTQSDSIPVQTAATFASGFTWRDRLSESDSITGEYTYRYQTTSGTSARNVDSHAASIGWSHKFTRTLGAAANAGPAWSFYAGNGNGSSRERTTVHGSLSLSDEFRKGGVIFSFARSNSFTGIISDGFHNRYDIQVHREFSSRFHVSGTASYVQQQSLDARNTTGQLFSAESRYFLSRNLAAFSQARYLNIGGNQRIIRPEKSVTIGIRWAWVPEKPWHQITTL